MPFVLNARHCPVCNSCWHAGATCSCMREMHNTVADPDDLLRPIVIPVDNEEDGTAPDLSATLTTNERHSETLPLPGPVVGNVADAEDIYNGQDDGANLPLPVLNFSADVDPYAGASLANDVLPLPRMDWGR